MAMRTWPVTVALRTAGMLCAVSILAFLVLHAMPGDPVAITLIADNVPVTPATVAALKHHWGLDRPLVAQYTAWLGRFTAGDWGRSFRTARPIRAELLGRLPTSLTLGLGGLALALGGGVVLGFLAARRPRAGAGELGALRPLRPGPGQECPRRALRAGGPRARAHAGPDRHTARSTQRVPARPRLSGQQCGTPHWAVRGPGLPRPGCRDVPPRLGGHAVRIPWLDV